MKKQYKNFAEQVSDNVENLELFNELSQVNEFWYEPLYEVLMNTLNPKDVIEAFDLSDEDLTDSEAYQEAEADYIFETMGSAYQLYKVELKGDYNDEHERLNIFYDDEVESYILPVFHFGTAWSIVGAMG